MRKLVKIWQTSFKNAQESKGKLWSQILGRQWKTKPVRTPAYAAMGMGCMAMRQRSLSTILGKGESKQEIETKAHFIFPMYSQDFKDYNFIQKLSHQQRKKIRKFFCITMFSR